MFHITGEIELMEQFADAAVEDDTRRLTLEAEQIADELLDSAVEELEEDVVETSIEKRDLTSGMFLSAFFLSVQSSFLLHFS